MLTPPVSLWCGCLSAAADHVSHLENVSEEEINRLLGMVVDVENLFMSVHKEEDTDTKQVYFYLFKVRLGLGTSLCAAMLQSRGCCPTARPQPESWNAYPVLGATALPASNSPGRKVSREGTG